jgi:hypothetical protein
MRRIVVCLTSMLLASSPSQAAPMLPGEFFTPESASVTLSAPLFTNGTDTFCWLCSDSDPLNDLKLVLSGRTPGTFGVEGFPTFFAADTLGEITASGPAPNFEGLNVSFSFRVTTTITTKINPDGSPELLPRPSVAEGFINGGVIGFEPRVLELHWGGQVDGLRFQESSIPQLLFVPPEGASKRFTSEIFLAEQVAYTPGEAPSVVPEPFSLLLLSSGLAAAALRRRRAPTISR